MTQPEKPLITRWTGAVLGFAMGAGDTLLLPSLGAKFELWVGAFFTSSFVALGFLLGLVLEARANERNQATRIGEQSRLLADAQLRVAHADKLASLGQLASTMAHELRNPLAIIRSTVQNLEETLSPGDVDARKTCRFVLDEIDRLTRVTASIVRFARPLVPKRSRIDAAQLFERTRALAERMLMTSSVTLSARNTAAGAMLDIDSDLVCQALLGLVDNASRFSPAGASVELAFSSDSETVVLRVDDVGPGVPKELGERLFEPFFTTRDDGTGLGLPIARQIVEAHGGRIGAGDRPGGGARFEIRLPIASSQELAA